jgi:dynactin complex subunit
MYVLYVLYEKKNRVEFEETRIHLLNFNFLLRASASVKQMDAKRLVAKTKLDSTAALGERDSYLRTNNIDLRGLYMHYFSY